MMTVTYDLASADPAVLLISRLRLEIGDTTLNQGVKPDESNFADAELQVFLTRASNNVEHAAAFLCDVLANTWARLADIEIGPRSENLSQVAKRYEARAKAYRDRLGISSAAFSGGMVRADGYAEYESDEEYTP